MKVFLGGTCNESKWRDDIIKMLKIDYFNPVVEDWTPECMAEEIRQRETCDYVLYVLTPRMTGVYSIAEAVDDSNKRPSKTVFCVLQEDTADDWNGMLYFSEGQKRSLNAVGKMIKENGGHYARNLQEAAGYLNGDIVK